MELSSELLLDFMRGISSGRSPRTVNNRRASILSIWIDAAEAGLAPQPPRRIAKKKVPASVPNAFTVDQVRSLLRACDDLEGDWGGMPVGLAWKIGIGIIWDTAMRVGTMVGLNLDDVDLHRRTVWASAATIKGGRSDRVFSLSNPTVDLIDRSKRYRRSKLFPFPWDRRRLYEHFDRIAKKAGIPTGRRWKFHCLRRTTESYAASVVGVEKAAEAVGHSAAVARRHYIAPAIVPPASLVSLGVPVL
jgi:integrase